MRRFFRPTFRRPAPRRLPAMPVSWCKVSRHAVGTRPRPTLCTKGWSNGFEIVPGRGNGSRERRPSGHVVVIVRLADFAVEGKEESAAAGVRECRHSPRDEPLRVPGGDKEWSDTEEYLANAINYVLERP